MSEENTFISLDLETTGLNYREDKIIEIGISKFSNGEVVDEFSTTVNPEMNVSDNIFMITGIEEEELKDSPTIDEILPAVRKFINDHLIIGHNIEFDLNFLSKHLKMENEYYDTLKLSRIYLPFADSHKLSYIAEYLDISYEDAHRALEDSIMSGKIFLKISEIMENLNPELLKKQHDVLERKHHESELIKKFIKRALKKGLNRKSYPLDIPVNFREHDGKEEIVEKLPVEEYFNNEKLEERNSQIEMAKLVHSTLNSEEFLLIEASAGTGKSLAYLIPAIITSRETGEPIYISSYTKNLQQQVFNHDIPLAEQITGIQMNTLLRKGRGNYLCIRKLREMPKDVDPVSKAAVYLWSQLTKTGDLSEISYIFREINPQLLSIDNTCSGEICPYFSNCFYYRMRRRIKNADLILVNHALFFTGNPEARKVIFDEAHEIEKAATSGFSIKINYGEIQAILNSLARETGSRKIKDNITETNQKAKDCFLKLGEKLLEDNEYRVGFFENRHLSPVHSLIENLRAIEKNVPEDEIEDRQILTRLREAIENTKLIVDQGEEDRVFYYKMINRNRPESVELIASPLDIGSYLEEYLYPMIESIVMTSATLTVGESFEFMKQILGLSKYISRLTEISLPDTYNFREQALTVIPSFLGAPNNSDYIEKVGKFIKDIILPEERGTLVLFTSYRHMKGVYQEIKDDFTKMGRELLIQGYGKSRKKLLSLFRQKRGSVLLGTGSFWQGIDVPGEPLEIVVIEKLPFPNPSEPFIGAKSDYFEKRGLGGFSSYMLPLSVLRFKQGFGRLIRSTRDMGVVFILDNRVINKSYGNIFLESLPTEISLASNSLEVKNTLDVWFNEGRVYNPIGFDDNWDEPF